MTHLLIVTHQSDLSDMVAAIEGEPDLRVSCCAATEALELVKSAACDVLLASVHLGDKVLEQLFEAALLADDPVKIVINELAQPEDALTYIEEGAAGYLCRGDSLAELVKQVRAVAAGEFMMAPSVAAALMARIAELKQLAAELSGPEMFDNGEAYAELTAREWEVLRLIARDYTNQQIADELTIELGTVKNHVHNLLRKLDVSSRKQAMRVARQLLGIQDEGQPERRPALTAEHTLRLDLRMLN